MSVRPQRVAILGQGYVGLPLALRAVEVGHDVVGFDVDVERVKRLRAGRSYVRDVTDDLIAAALATERYRPSAEPGDLAGFDVAIVTVPTPLRDGAPDLSHIEGAARTLAPHVTPGCVVVLESTTYPGTTAELVAPALEAGSGLVAGADFRLGYSPERINPGDPAGTLERMPKVVSGIDDASLAAVRAFYDGIVERTVPVGSTQVAELTKLLENTFRHVNVALVNELATFAADLGIDVWEAIDAADTKPFGYLRFEPGPGVGGHCLPVDPSYLSWRVRTSLGTPFRFVELANDVNAAMPAYVVQRVTMALNDRGAPVRDARVLVLGLAYKPETADARESPAVAIVARFAALGARVRVCDPYVVDEVQGLDAIGGVARVELDAAEVAAADAVVVVTAHEAFDLEMVRDRAHYVLDTRHRVPPGPAVEYL